MTLFDLVAKLTLDSSEYEEGISSAGKTASSFASKIGQGIGTAAKVGAAAITAVATAAVAVGTAMTKAVSETAAYGDTIDKMSQKMNLSASAYQEWDAVMQHCGTSIESLQSSMKTLANAAENNNEAFERLGITQEQIANMSNEELFSATISALQGVESETERTYLAGKLLGRGATELGPLLNMTAEETQGLKDRVHELGGVMSDEAVKAAAAYQDSMQDMKTAFSGVSRGLVSELLPSWTTIIDGLTEIFSGSTEKGAQMISDGVDAAINQINKLLPQVTKVGGQIISGIGKAIQKNLPKMLKTGADIVGKLVSGIVTALPQMLTTGIQAVTEFVQGMVEGVPEAIPQIVSVIMDIVDALTDPGNLTSLLDAGLQIVIALADGLINAVPVIIERLPEIIENIVTGLVEAAPMLLEAGAHLIGSLVEGLIESVPKIIEAIPLIAQTLVAGFSQLWENLKEIGRSLIERIREGFSEKMEAFSESVRAFGEKIKTWFEGIPQWFSELPEKIGYHLGVVTGKLVQFGQDAYAWAQENIPQIVENVSTFFSEMPGKIGNFLEESRQKFISFAALMLSTAKVKIPELISTIVSFFQELPGRLLEIGKNLVEGLWNGIVGAWDWLVGNVSSLIGGFVQGIKDTLGISSPSKVFAEIGKNMALGLDEGFNDAFPEVNKDIIGEINGMGKSESSGCSESLSAMMEVLTEIRDKIGGDVVLDSGELVGYMDAALGALSVRKARGGAFA